MKVDRCLRSLLKTQQTLSTLKVDITCKMELTEGLRVSTYCVYTHTHNQKQVMLPYNDTEIKAYFFIQVCVSMPQMVSGSQKATSGNWFCHFTLLVLGTRLGLKCSYLLCQPSRWPHLSS